MNKLDCSNLSYRSDIDGLRAVAVLSVILFHAEAFGLSGGFVGVDVFFVISGYLISQRILYGELRGGFSFQDFYVRRIRRLFPALFSTSLFTLLAGFALLSPAALSALATSAVSAVFSVANIQYFLEAGYWDAVSSSKPLLHMWSLSVEEQFYLMWPIFLLILLRRFRSNAFWILTATAVASLLITGTVNADMPYAAFYLTPFRVYEFALGALCVWSDGSRWTQAAGSRFIQALFFVSGLGLVLGSIVLFDETMLFPGYWAAIPTLGTSLIILAKSPPILEFVLTNRLSRFIGLISYSLYLVHWPVLVLWPDGGTTQSTYVTLALQLGVIFSLSIAQYRFVETPLRYGKVGEGRSSTTLFTVGRSAGIAIVSIIALTSVIIINDGFPRRYTSDLQDIAALPLQEIRVQRLRDKSVLCRRKTSATICGELDANRVDVLIVGDSHGPDGLNIMRVAYPDVNYLIAERVGCPLLFDLDGVPHSYSDCDSYNELRFREIETVAPSLDVVVLSHRMSRERTAGTREVIRWLRTFEAELVVLGAGPWYEDDLITYIMAHGTLHELDESLAKYEITSQYDADRDLAPLTVALGGTYLPKRGFFCPQNLCRVMTSNGEPLTFDAHHLTLSAAQDFGQYLGRNYPKLIRNETAREISAIDIR